MERYQIVLQFFVDGDEDSAVDVSEQFSTADGIPRIGESVAYWGNRDEDGNYTDKIKKHFEGIVTEIKHSYEQRGSGVKDYMIMHFIQVLVRTKATI